MEINRVVSYLARINIDEGTRDKPILLYVTKGGKENSLIFHFKENGKHYQYRAKWVYKNSILLMCIYKRNYRSNDCKAFVTITPNLADLIISRRTAENRRLRYFFNYEKKIEEISYTDLTVKSSNKVEHSAFCVDQVPLHEREYSQFIGENGTGLEIQNDRRKYARFGPGQPLMRAFRPVHTKKSVISGHLAIEQTKLDFNMDLISVQGVNSDFLEILRTPDDITTDAIPETFIHLDLQTENMVPCFLRSEISKLNHKDLYLDGTFSLVRNLDYSQIYILGSWYSSWYSLF